MAIIGRMKCPWCGFDHAHIKRTEGKRAYHHCPNCGCMTHAKNGHQEGLMVSGMRPIDGIAIEPAKAAQTTAPAPAPVPTQPPKPQGFWDQLASRRQ